MNRYLGNHGNRFIAWLIIHPVRFDRPIRTDPADRHAGRMVESRSLILTFNGAQRLIKALTHPKWRAYMVSTLAGCITLPKVRNFLSIGLNVGSSHDAELRLAADSTKI